MPKLCEFETCRNRATYGTNCNPVKCKEHKDDNMRLSSSLCECGKQKRCNFKGLNPLYCANCKPDINMIDVKQKVCIFNDCDKYPCYNYQGETERLFCFEHKLINMVNIKSIKCIFDNCNTVATNNYKNMVNPIYCVKHKLDNMIDVKSKKCIYKDCYKQPSCNYKGILNSLYCSEHKLNDMVDVKSKRCFFENCNKQPTFNFKNTNIALYCSEHKLENMHDVKHHICKSENCETIGNKNYKGYCANCFQHLFPTDPLTFQIRSKTKEIAVRDFINSRFEGFQHDKPLWYNGTSCDCTTKRRIDHRKLINDTLLCIETDENQHKSYSKEDEIARYNDLFMAFGGKFIFIRFNPDKYKDNGKSCNPMLVNRLPVLETEINKQIKRIETNENTELLEVIELYYDKYQ
jgi:hypothetical protein